MSAFTPAGSGGLIPTVSVSGATTPTVAELDLTLAATEYSYTVPTNAKQFLLKLRSPAVLQVSYVSGQSGTTYITVPRGCFYAESDLNLSGPVTIYMQSPSAAQVAEITLWV